LGHSVIKMIFVYDKTHAVDTLDRQNIVSKPGQWLQPVIDTCTLA
jgi:hypothetical protein